MKILFLTSEFPPNVGGIGNHGYNVALNLARLGHDVTVIADSLLQPKEILSSFAAEQPFKIVWIPRNKFVVITYINRIFQAIKVAKNHQVIFCSGKFSLWTGGILSLFNQKKKLIAVVHGSELDLKQRFLKKMTTWSLGKMKEIISVSRYTATYLPKQVESSIPITIIPNGITLTEFTPYIPQNTTSLKGEPSVITLGNVSQRKGQLNFIQALPHLITLFPQIHYHIVGKPSEKEKFERIAHQLQVSSYITFHGMVDRDQLMHLLKGAQVKAMLSNHTPSGDFEGFGIAILEANIFGVPSIGSIDSGIADAILDGETGFLVHQKDPESIGNSIQKIMNNYSAFSEASITWAKKHDWAIIIHQYEAIALRTASN